MKLNGLPHHRSITITTVLTITTILSPPHPITGFTLAPPQHPIVSPPPTVRPLRQHRRSGSNTRFAAPSAPLSSSESATCRNDTTGPAVTATAPPAAPPVRVPRCIESAVLKKVYPAILTHIEEYGNPNIPLGTKDGKRCKILRRMAFQQTLSPEEIQLLTEMGFRWNNFEDVYEDADFDDCLNRLVEYEKEQKSGYQIPKKYHPDPELGAWVCVIRRIKRANIEPQRRARLDAIGFAWKSNRSCGSSFMSTYKSLRLRLEAVHRNTGTAGPSGADADDDDGAWELVDPAGLEAILREEAVRKWLVAQREAVRSGGLSESRIGYMDRLPGFDWRIV